MRKYDIKRLLPMALLLLAGGAASVEADSAVGSAFGTLTTAQPLGQGRANLGTGVGITDNSTSLTGTLAYGLSQYTDGRIRLGLVDPDGGDTEFTIGADLKWQFWDIGPETDYPFDFAVGGLLEYASFDFGSVFQIGGLLIASYPLELESSGSVSLYGRFNTRLEAISYEDVRIENGTNTDNDSRTNLELGISGGVQWIWTPTISFFGEFQIDGNDGLFIGVDFNVM